MINFTCACGKSLTVADESVGNMIKCVSCGKVVPVMVVSRAVDEATAGLPSLDADATDATLSERPTNPATSALDPTIAPSRSAARRDIRETDPIAAPAHQSLGASWSLGAYRVLRELGQGGMGVVYEAEDVKLERRVALKVLKPEIAANQEQRERFLHEAGTAAGVESDFLCPIYEVGEENGVPFIAMPFLKGKTLDGHVKENLRLATEEVVRIGKEVAEGLSAAHEAGLFHCDLKPANIWLETQRSGPARAIILDFGLARMKADHVQITQSGVIPGTPAYMSPEQARGDKNVDARTDLFSLGCVLYALSTGALPTHDPTPPHTVAATTPKPLSDLIMRLLAKNPDDRAPTARDVIDKLVEIETALPKPAKTTRISPTLSPARSASSGGETATGTQLMAAVAAPRVRRRRKTLVAASLLGFILALAGGIYYVVMDKGTIEIQTEDENVQISLLKNGQEIEILDAASKKTWSIHTGKYTVRLKGDSNALEIGMPDTFELKRGRTHIVTIRKQETDPVKLAVNRLKELNPGFDGNVTPTVQDGVVTGLKFLTDDVDNITPLRSLKGLTLLDCSSSQQGKGKLADISPLEGMPLTSLNLSSTQVRDLSPLKGMPLTTLNLNGCAQVGDLTPLKGMPLTFLSLDLVNVRGQVWLNVRGQVRDLEPLKGMPLTSLNLNGSTEIEDLTPLKGMPLTFLSLDLVNVRGQVRDLGPLKGMPLTSLYLNCSQVRDLESLKGMPLTTLNLNNCTELQDLSPLKGMKLTRLYIGGIYGGTQVRDLSPLKDMKLQYLNCSDSKVSDLSPLQGMQLEDIRLTPKNITQGLDTLRDMNGLKTIGIDFYMGWPVAEFWARYDKGEFK